MRKYLHLAIAMTRNRGDWSDGYSYVTDALRDFEIENELDQDIYDELEEIVYGYEYDSVDGRHFRDCEHNYTWIYATLLTEEEQNEYNNAEW
jgi:hypothetical protein